MSDPFPLALAALHASPLGLDARYMADGDDPIGLRVIRSQGSQVSGQTILDVDSVSIQRADVLRPVRGDQVQLLGTISILGTSYTDPVFRISQDPMFDEEGLSWTCPIALV